MNKTHSDSSISWLMLEPTSQPWESPAKASMCCHCQWPKSPEHPMGRQQVKHPPLNGSFAMMFWDVWGMFFPRNVLYNGTRVDPVDALQAEI